VLPKLAIFTSTLATLFLEANVFVYVGMGGEEIFV